MSMNVYECIAIAVVAVAWVVSKYIDSNRAHVEVTTVLPDEDE